MLSYFLPLLWHWAFAAFNFAAVKKMPEGSERMSEIAAAIRVGANAFINYEYRILAIVVACIAVLMAIITTCTPPPRCSSVR